VIAETLDEVPRADLPDLDAVFDADRQARSVAGKVLARRRQR
jgi:hypothetical protein